MAVPHVFMIFVPVDGAASSGETPFNSLLLEQLNAAAFTALLPALLGSAAFGALLLSQFSAAAFVSLFFALLCAVVIGDLLHTLFSAAAFASLLLRLPSICSFTSCTTFGLLALLLALLAYLNQVKQTPAEVLQQYTPSTSSCHAPGQECANTLWSLSCPAALPPCYAP